MPYTISPCDWCGAETHDARDGNCTRCGCIFEYDGEGDGEDMRSWRTVTKPGKAKLRRDPLDWTDGPADDGAVSWTEDEALGCVWSVIPTVERWRLVRERTGRPDETVGVYASIEDAKAAAAAGGVA